MHFVSGHTGKSGEVSDLFLQTFTASEGADEGNLIAGLVNRMMQSKPDEGVLCFSACEGETLLGTIFFSPLVFSDDARRVFILSPVAVKTAEQGKGIGQKLILHGLSELRKDGVSVAMTYGDPNFYARVGFLPVTEEMVPAPLKLSFPHGWLGQSLTSDALTPLQGVSRCVEALNKPELW